MDAMSIELEVMNVFFTFQTLPDTSLEKGEEDEGEETAIGSVSDGGELKKTSRNLKIDVLRCPGS